jgi:hypothetical protein
VEAYDQCKLYRSYLQDEKSRLWKHVLLGTGGTDEGFWSTGKRSFYFLLLLSAESSARRSDVSWLLSERECEVLRLSVSPVL